MAKWVMDYKTIKYYIRMEHYVVFQYHDEYYGIGALRYGRIQNTYLIDFSTGHRQLFFVLKNLWKHAKIGKTTLQIAWEEAEIVIVDRYQMVDIENEYLQKTCERQQHGE